MRRPRPKPWARKVEKMEQPKRYRYKMTARPFASWNLPKGWKDAGDLQVRAGYYGWVEFERRLDAEECERYDLKPVNI